MLNLRPARRPNVKISYAVCLYFQQDDDTFSSVCLLLTDWDDRCSFGSKSRKHFTSQNCSHNHRHPEAVGKEAESQGAERPLFMSLCVFTSVYCTFSFCRFLAFLFYVRRVLSSYLYFHSDPTSPIFFLTPSPSLLLSITFQLLSYSRFRFGTTLRQLLTQRTQTTREVFLSFFKTERERLGWISSSGLPAATGKVHSRNMGQSDCERRPELLCFG